jgi:RNA polymerase sigma-70 factor, ECF subfamily
LPPSDEDLLLDVQNHSKSAFDELFSRYERSIRKRLRSILRDQDAAEDILQEAFVRVWEKASHWDGRGTASGWIYRIAVNLALSLLRGRKRHKELPLVVTVPAADDEDDESEVPSYLASVLPGPPAQLESCETRSYVQELIDQLPESKRTVMHMVHCEDLSVREVSEALDIPDGTVKSRLFYGRKAIQDRLKSYLEE